MPIILDTPTTPPVEASNPIVVTAPAFRGVTVDTRYDPATSLLTHIEGASWTVNYYSQVLDQDNALSGQNQDRDPVYQQYKLIQHLELKVTTPLNQSQDTATMEFKITGQANVYPCGLTPNVGDMFIADGGDGRELVFQLTNTEKRSIYKDAAFIIDYEALNYSDTRIDDLNSKVVQNLYFDQDRSLNGQNPLISLDESNLINQMKSFYDEILDFYFTRFTSKEYRTLLLPGQEFATYDPFLVKAVLKMFRDSDIPQVKFIRELNVGEFDHYDIITVWDLLFKKRRPLLRGMMKTVGLVNAKCFTMDPMQNSIRYSGIAFVVYPTDGFLSEDTLRRDNTLLASDTQVIHRTPSQLKDLFDLITEVSLHGLIMAEIDPINLMTDHYIFSAEFYANVSATGQSAMELLLQDYIDGNAYDLTVINRLSSTYTSWSPLEQFYQLPFLLAIMRSAIRRV